ncbi:porin family protein [Pseudobacter ginsenosidimutans]|jgi:hypothetical protein|nr:porin family protein [Pseudobacter ginsenosidimutans]QEC45410.1 PorT family protein [Pseudobacter ginsenosidimutans]
MHKKYCLATCLCLLLSIFLNAQLRVGVKGGLNFNQPVGKEKNGSGTGKHIDRYDLHTDFHAGLTADIPVTQKFHIRPDLLFSRRMAKYGTSSTEGSVYRFYEETLKADFLEIPVHFVYYHQMKHLALYLGGGPYIGFALSGKAKNYGGSRTGTDLGEQISVYASQEEDWYKKTSFGAVLAAGIDLPFGLTGELSVHRAFNDVNNSHLVNTNTKVINFNYAVSVGYLLGRKRS